MPIIKCDIFVDFKTLCIRNIHSICMNDFYRQKVCEIENKKSEIGKLLNNR